jgi:pyruvate,water dikinase
MELLPLSDRIEPGIPIGGKAAHILWLLGNDFRVPETWVIPAGEPPPKEAFLATGLPDDGPWAVRSSAAVEDGFESSYAGQFATVLDVTGPGAVAAAIRRVHDSATGATAAAYRERMGDGAPVAMAVMVQRMVSPRASGVAFSRNPMTGLNEVVIEAVAGKGDALVGGGVTPERWIRRWGAWSARPDAGATLPELVARGIAAETIRAGEEFGSPVDLEWVWDGNEVWWVQVRPITGLDDVSVYSNRISREVMPGMIKPLVWSVNVPVVNRAWISLFGELIGPNDLQPEQLAKSFAYRSYFNMGTIGEIFALLGMPRDGLEMLLGLPAESKPKFRPSAATMRHLPRLLTNVLRKARYGAKLQPEIDELRRRFATIAKADLEALSDSGLLSKVDELAQITTRAAYANIVTPLLANLYVALLRRSLNRKAIDPDDLDLELGDPTNPYNPNPALDRLGTLIAAAGPETVDAVRAEGLPALPDHLEPALEQFMREFGHLSDSGNDFSVPPWVEQPDAVLRMAIDHAEVSGEHHATPWQTATANLGPVARRTLRLLHSRSSEFVDHREQVSFVYTYGYGLFRPIFHEIGRRMVKRDLIGSEEDVMYLERDEIRTALLDGSPTRPPGELVALRRQEMADLADVAMPETIFGDDFVPVKQGLLEVDEVAGVATSRGRHRGTLRVVTGIDDFARVEAGDVIAIPFSDIGWTPLFARAGAVIAEAGGILSHSSIVAREYRIPCVVSVGGATNLPDGATVVVDGYTGTVIVESDAPPATGTDEPPATRADTSPD